VSRLRTGIPLIMATVHVGQTETAEICPLTKHPMATTSKRCNEEANLFSVDGAIGEDQEASGKRRKPHLIMTTEEYGIAYKKGYIRTTRFLVRQGMSWDCAKELAQAAWVRGWERRGQLRETSMVTSWINTIALNMHRTDLGREPFFLQEVPEIPAPPERHLAAIDVQLLMQVCRKKDRFVLQRYYLDECGTQEIARAQGLTVTAVRLRLLRARRGLAKTLNAISRPATLPSTKPANA
jgi:RNA polymerase sigma factor (sigma-70 family)